MRPLDQYPFGLLAQRGYFLVAPVGARGPDPVLHPVHGAWDNEWPPTWLELDLDPHDGTPGALPLTVEPVREEFGEGSGLFGEAHEYVIVLPALMPDPWRDLLTELQPSHVEGVPPDYIRFSLGWQSADPAFPVRALWYRLVASTHEADRSRKGRAFLTTGYTPLRSSMKMWVGPGAAALLHPEHPAVELLSTMDD